MDAHTLTTDHVEHLVSLLRHWHPNWDGFDDAKFMEDEVNYKQQTVELAANLLSREELSGLLDQGAYDTFVERLVKVGQDPNLLWLRSKSTGDLNVLYADGLDRGGLCTQVFDLLYGPGEVLERFDRYVAYVLDDGLPNKWTFPTFFLFVCHPETELFVKPGVTRRVMKELGYGPLGAPSAEEYARVRQLAHDLFEQLEPYGPRDMIDVQSVVWVCGKVLKEHNKAASQARTVLSEERLREFEHLFEAFIVDYVDKEAGPWHAAFYARAWEDGRRWLSEIVEAADRGEDVTDRVLLGLLPHADTEGNRERGAWISPAPAITKDIKTWYENAGWVSAEDWPGIAHAVLGFVRRCTEHPDELDEAVDEFVSSGYAKGFQSGILTPILHAVDPEHFVLANSKSVRVVNHFAGTNHGTDLASFPAFNALAFRLVDDVEEVMEPALDVVHEPTDALDMMAHWLVAERRYFEDEADNTVEGRADALAAPFSDIFADREEAEWALAFLRRTLELLGAYGPGAAPVALTLPGLGWNHVLRLNFGQWFVLDFRGPDNKYPGSTVALLDHEGQALGLDPSAAEPFAGTEDEPVRLFHVSFEALQDMSPAFEELYEASMRHIGERFGAWSGSPFKAAHRPVVEEAVFDPAKRDALLRSGIEMVDEAPEDSATEMAQGPAGTPGVGEAPAVVAGVEDVFSVAPTYSLAQCSEETGHDLEDLERWVRALHRKGQAVLYGPPGTGKTYVAERLARHVVGGDNGFYDTVQFHPAYAYEDFMEGIRPQTRDGGGLAYPSVPGRFLDFCRRARARRGHCVLIVDEINRANLARVFGELMFLLEYRERSIPLASGRTFSIPRNVRMIGTMNTADRSIALVDHALRRRFAFIGLWPEMDMLGRYHAREETGFDAEPLAAVLADLNEQIGDPHYAVGTSYFLRPDLGDHLEDVWRMEIEPYLEEYFFDQAQKVEEFRWRRVADRLKRAPAPASAPAHAQASALESDLLSASASTSAADASASDEPHEE